MDDLKEPEFPAGTLAPPTGFLRRQRDEDGHSRPGSRASSAVSKKRKHKKWDDGIGPGGPISQSAIFPNRPSQTEGSEKDPSPPTRETTDSTMLSEEHYADKHAEKDENAESHSVQSPKINIYEEGSQLVFENEDGDVLDVQSSPQPENEDEPKTENESKPATGRPALTSSASGWRHGGWRRKMSEYYSSELEKRKDKGKSDRRHEPARAYQFGNMVSHPPCSPRFVYPAFQGYPLH